MPFEGKSRPAKFVGRIFLSLALLSGAAPGAAPGDVDQLLKHADDIKTANNSEFLEIVRRLDGGSADFSPTQLAWLHYLKAWQLGYTGDYEAAVPALKAVSDEAKDPIVRFRADISLINDQALTSHYEEAYARLSDLLERQPQVPDKNARMLAFAVAALLYNEAGQYDLGMNYAERWLAEDGDGVGACKATYQKLDSLFRSHKLDADDPLVRSGIDACNRIGEPLFANLIRTFVANVEIANGKVADAIELIRKNDEEVQRTHSARVTSEFHSILARGYLITGDLARARQYARSAIDKSIKNQSSKPLVDAYAVLYKVAQAEGDYQSALAYHEKYAEADKGYLTDTTARTLAYQMVNQQVLDKKRQIEALTETNQVLQLEQRVAEKSAETERLYVLLLVSVLGFILLWAYRTKRSQMRFQKLARRDGLTGILNRQHFMDEAKVVLHYCSRSAREACMILVDFDNFKVVNDTHGHVAGDVVLQSAVAVLQVHMRSVDIFGRLGGEEFGILLPDCGIATALQRAEQLRVSIAGLARSETGIDFDVSASFGVTTTLESGYDLRQMLIHADSALYRAKREGRNRVATFLVTLADSAKVGQADAALAAAAKTGA